MKRISGHRMYFLMLLGLLAAACGKKAAPAPQGKVLDPLRQAMGLVNGAQPVLAWRSPLWRVYSAEKLSPAFYYGLASPGLAATWKAAAEADEIGLARKTAHVFCDPSIPYQAYDLAGPKFISKTWERGILAPQIAKDVRAIPWHRGVDAPPGPGRPKLAEPLPKEPTEFVNEIIFAEGEPLFLRLEAYYLKGQDPRAVWAGMSWVGQDGVTISTYALNKKDLDEPCADCSPPQKSDGFNAIFHVLGFWKVPGISEPVILMDSSTFEGRAFSLAGINADGSLDEIRVYEYVVTCGD